MNYVLKVACVYCGKQYATKPCNYKPEPDMDTSHGACQSCFKKENDKLTKLITQNKKD